MMSPAHVITREHGVFLIMGATLGLFDRANMRTRLSYPQKINR